VHRLKREAIRAAWAAYARSNDPSNGEQFHGGVLYMGKAEGGSVVALAENHGNGYFKVELALESDCLRFSRVESETFDWLQPGWGQILQVAVPDAAKDRDGSVSWHSKYKFHVKGSSPDTPWHCPPVEPEEGNLHAPFCL